ncbi:MAG: M23 family metallopeptidase [Campylobacterales bacterium]|nr:M23 family metallopeptidase [Campylobacterales bacterium]
MRYMLLFTFFILELYAFDLSKVELSSFKVANGKTLLVEFLEQKEIEYERISLGEESFGIFDNPLNKGKKYALIPIEYYAKKENKKFLIHYRESGVEKKEDILFKVVDGAYKKEHIEVQQEKVNPQKKEVKERIAKEYAEAMAIYNHVTKNSYLQKPFILPLESLITSDFGKARVYNGSLKGYHSGTDFRAKIGTPVYAVNDGKVALVQDRFYSGGTVLLDHGEGIYTCYFHLNTFDVREGDLVKRGQQIALSGKSGRVTGPHLHFSARVNGVQVDPLQLIELLNNKLLKGEKKL